MEDETEFFQRRLGIAIHADMTGRLPANFATDRDFHRRLRQRGGFISIFDKQAGARFFFEDNVVFV